MLAELVHVELNMWLELVIGLWLLGKFVGFCQLCHHRKKVCELFKDLKIILKERPEK